MIAGRREDKLNETLALCPGPSLAIVSDVTKEEDVIRLFSEAAKRFGPKIDMVFNNAGSAYQLDQIHIASNLDFVM